MPLILSNFQHRVEDRRIIVDTVVSEVRCCLESGNYRAALVLALTIPDTCGLVEHPEFRKKSKKRYVA